MKARDLTGNPADADAGRAMDFTPYEKRSYASLGLWSEDAWALKVYGIDHRAERFRESAVDPAIVAAARAKVRAHLPEVEREGDHHHTGFVILHRGIGGTWLLLHWWVQESICAEALWKAPDESPTEFEAGPGSFMACVWELVVIDFERRAWVDAMLRLKGDRDRYLDTWLPDGAY